MRVTAKVKAEGNDPVDINWVSNGNEMDVISSVASLLRMEQEQPRDVWQPALLSITIEM